MSGLTLEDLSKWLICVNSVSSDLLLSLAKPTLSLTKSGNFLKSEFSGMDKPISNFERVSISEPISTVRVTPDIPGFTPSV